MLTKTQRDELQKNLNDYLQSYFEKTIESASNEQLYNAISAITSKLLRSNRLLFERKYEKTVHYLCIEFLIGKSLKNNLWNLGIENNIKKILKSFGKNIDDIFLVENDASLGNGGLGRLAACYLESFAKLGFNAVGHSIKYEYGLFKQKIEDGKQIELPDEWLKNGKVWLFERNDRVVEIEIGGRVIEHFSEDRGLSFEIVDAIKIEAIPFDMMISSFGTNNLSTLRLWEAQAKNAIDLHLFDFGEYESSLKQYVKISEINKILYPNDESEKGKELRLVQQYFLVSSAMQDIVNEYFEKNIDLQNFSKNIAIHINDTHPALCIPELMRILIDKNNFGWEVAWQAVCETISYTNHTILSESLEVKKMYMIEKYIPRIAQIIKEIDRRFKIELGEFFKNDYAKIDKLSIISGNNVYMANLAICASSHINGVAKIHSEILKNRIFYDFYKMYPEKFTNITNGISHRRWLSQSNPKLDKLIISLIGNKYYDNPDELLKLESFEKDDGVLERLEKIKFDNKRKFCKFAKQNFDIEIDPSARFDVQVKRIHEYKRQLLNALKIIYLMGKIRNNPNDNYSKEVFIFAGKAATGYKMAKRFIELICSISKEISEDEIVSKYLQVVFLENYNVSMAEILMPATEVSEQISLAGREASGTGNMKAVINGALMLCTIDGANIEICEKCDRDNMFEFGLTADEVNKVHERGYNPRDYLSNEKIRFVIDTLNNGIGGEKYDDIARYLLGSSNIRDNYLCLADFESYLNAYYEMNRIYKNKKEWNRRCLHSIANMGYFSSDRSVDEYAHKIWKIKD